MAYTGNLKGTVAWVFRQSVYGSVGHLVTDATEYLEAWSNGGSETLRINTWCRKSYKFNSQYSKMEKRSNAIRNACEYCFVEFDPEDQVGKRREASKRKQVAESDLPF